MNFLTIRDRSDIASRIRTRIILTTACGCWGSVFGRRAVDSLLRRKISGQSDRRETFRSTSPLIPLRRHLLVTTLHCLPLGSMSENILAQISGRFSRKRNPFERR